jgi:hypothetical protein
MKRFLPLALAAVLCVCACPDIDRARAAAPPAAPLAAPPAEAGKDATSSGVVDKLYARLARTRYPEEAEGILAEIEHVRMQSGSDAADLLLTRAMKARESAQLGIALQLFDVVVDLYPDWSEAWSERATARFQNGDVDGAMGDLAQTLLWSRSP